MKNLEEYKVFLAVNHRKKLTANTYYNSVKYFSKWLNDRPIDKTTVNQWVIYLYENYRPNAIVTHIIGLNKYLDYIGRKELKVKRPKWGKTYRKTISYNDIQRMILTAERLGPKYELVIRFITDCDCRNNEITYAKWNNICNDKIYFDDTKTGDNFAFLSPALMDILERYKQIRPKPKKGYEDYILIGDKSSNRGTWIKERTLNHYVKTIALKSRIGRKVTFYDLRASVITAEFNNYINPKIIQQKARHRNPLTTQKYNHVDDEMVKEYINFDLIFDKQRLSVGKRKQKDINDLLCRPDSQQDLNNPLESEDNNNFSFSILSFYANNNYQSNTDGFIHEVTPFNTCFFICTHFNPSGYIFTKMGVDFEVSTPTSDKGYIHNLGADTGYNNLHHLSSFVNSFFHKNLSAPASHSLTNEIEENRTKSNFYGSSFFSSHNSCSLFYFNLLI